VREAKREKYAPFSIFLVRSEKGINHSKPPFDTIPIRLLVRVNYPYRLIYVRFIGTHAQYNRINVEEV